MTRLAKKCGALSKIGLALALFGGMMLGVSQTARALEAEQFNGDFFTNYFINGPLDIITVVNGTNNVPLEETPSGSDLVNICANLYFFTPDQQPAGCCQQTVSPSGIVEVGIARTLAGFTAQTGVAAPTTGSVKIVASTVCNSNASADLLSPANKQTQNQLHAWITHTHALFSGSAFTTELPFSQTGEPVGDWTVAAGSHLLSACFAGGPGPCAGGTNRP